MVKLQHGKELAVTQFTNCFTSFGNPQINLLSKSAIWWMKVFKLPHCGTMKKMSLYNLTCH